MTKSDDLSEFFEKVKKGNMENKKFIARNNTESECVEPPIAFNSSNDCFVSEFNRGDFEKNAERRWAANDDKFWACQQSYEELPSGLYRPMYSNSVGHFLEKQILDTDEILVLPDTASEDVLEEIRKFWGLKDVFHARGFIHKRGILLWGKPGSGKTSTIQLIIKSLIQEHNGIAIFAGHHDVTSNCLQMLRKIEPARPLIVIMEDIDALVMEYGESGYLALLDGESQVSNVVFIATTNYPERLDRRFVDRPSRFDTIKHILMPGEAARRVYLKAKESTLENDELENWVNLSKGFSIAHLKEMIISNRCYGKPIDEVVKRLRKMNNNKTLSSDNADENDFGIGF